MTRIEHLESLWGFSVRVPHYSDIVHIPAYGAIHSDDVVVSPPVTRLPPIGTPELAVQMPQNRFGVVQDP